MPTATQAIAQIRDSVFGVLRLRPAANMVGQYEICITGSAWCISAAGAFATAYHVFNGSNPRSPQDKFYVVRAPNNGAAIQSWAIAQFPFEDSARDFAIFSAPPLPGVNLSPVVHADTVPPDGTPVLTYAYPSPAATGGQVDAAGNLTQINAFLFSHGSQGILAARYAVNDQDSLMEFDVRWHHGESGGPVFSLEPEARVISIMQHYREIPNPKGGVLDGPRRGYAINAFRTQIEQSGGVFA